MFTTFQYINDVPGLLLFASQYPDGSGDFISLNIDQGVVDYRFNMGSGTVIIRSDHRIQLNTWHEIYVEKQGKKGTLIIDDKNDEQFHGESEVTNLNKSICLHLNIENLI